MSIISGIQTFIKTCPSLENDKVMIDQSGPDTISYGIIPMPNGSIIVSENIDGSSTREYAFAFQTSAMTGDDAERLLNSEFQETFADWLETQSLAEILPTLGAKQTATKIEATDRGALFAQGESGTAIYQITCKLTYDQTA